VPARLAALGALAGMSESAVCAQASSALDAVLHMRRSTFAHRWVAEVGVLTRTSSALQCVPALSVSVDGRVTEHEAWGTLAGRAGI